METSDSKFIEKFSVVECIDCGKKLQMICLCKGCGINRKQQLEKRPIPKMISSLGIMLNSSIIH